MGFGRRSRSSLACPSAVSGRGFATLLGWVAENVIAVTRIGSDVAPLPPGRTVVVLAEGDLRAIVMKTYTPEAFGTYEDAVLHEISHFAIDLINDVNLNLVASDA